jgi:hypothetical protein
MKLLPWERWRIQRVIGLMLEQIAETILKVVIGEVTQIICVEELAPTVHTAPMRRDLLQSFNLE